MRHSRANITKMINKKLLLLCIGLIMTTQMIFSQVPSYVPTNGLVGYWPFNGNANDQSGNGNNGTVNGATITTDRFGNANSAYNFDGINDFIEVPVQQQNISSYSILCWFKYPTLPLSSDYKAMVQASGGYPNSQYSLSLQMSANPLFPNQANDKVSVSINGAGVFNGFISNNTYNDNTWHCLVGVWEAPVGVQSNSLYVKMYLDGVLINDNSTEVDYNSVSTPINGYGNTLFGMMNHLIGNRYFDGELDDIGIWNRALSQQEITTMYNGVNYSDTCNAVSGSLTNGLVGYWPFCGNANDDSGNGNNGTVNGATLTTDRFGNSNSAYSFDGVNDYISTSYIGELGSNSRSISFWYNSFTNNTDETVFTDYGGNNCGEGFACALFPSNKAGVDNTCSYIKSNSMTSVNNWNYFTVTYNSSESPNIINCKLYINGDLQSTSQSSTLYNINTINGINMIFGSSRLFNPVQYFNGKIDDIGIWNRALTQQEITQLYNQNQCTTNITVTDTLIINVGQLSYTNPVTYANNITIYPNPANTQVNISFNNITDLTGGNINIINSLGQQVATTPITLSGTNTTMPLNTWGGTGLYFVQILNAQAIVVDVKKIILQ